MPHLEHCTQFWGPQERCSKSGEKPLSFSQGWATSPVKTDWESWDCSAWRKGDSREAFQYLKGFYKKAGEGPFTRVCRDRTSGNGLKLKKGRFRLVVRKKIISCEGSKALEQVTQRDCGLPFLELFKSRLDRGLSNLVQWHVSIHGNFSFSPVEYKMIIY